MKLFFAKWLPVEGEIKAGMSFQGRDIKTKDVWFSEIFAASVDINKGDTMRPVKLFLCSRDIKVGDTVNWFQQTYAGKEEWKNYIGRDYILLEPIGLGLGMIELKDLHPKKTPNEIKESMLSFLQRKGVDMPSEKIEENVKRNVETSGSMFLKVGYNISELDIVKKVGEISPDAYSFVKEGDEFDVGDVVLEERVSFRDKEEYFDTELQETAIRSKASKYTICKIKGPCGHLH